MKTILLCTDCSENAQKATDECIRLFKNQEINYLLLYSYYISNESITDLIGHTDALKKEVNRRLASEVSRIKSLHRSFISITPLPIFGKTENVVERMLIKYPIDLVVMGHQGENHSQSQLFGSTTENLLYTIKCPKLIVPQTFQYNTNGKKIAIVQNHKLSDFDWWSNITSLADHENSSFKLIILPNEQKNQSDLQVPSEYNEQLSSVFDFTTKTSTEINNSIENILRLEKPDLLHINIDNRLLAKQLLSKQQSTSNIYRQLPIFIQPFKTE